MKPLALAGLGLIICLGALAMLYRGTVHAPLVTEPLPEEPATTTVTKLPDAEPEAPVPHDPAQPSGVLTGTVTLSPICPVEKDPPEPACAPKPYATSIRILNAAGRTVLTTTSDAAGRFSAKLPYGSYRIVAGNGSATPPTCPQTEVRVDAPTEHADISCDTGIR